MAHSSWDMMTVMMTIKQVKYDIDDIDDVDDFLLYLWTSCRFPSLCMSVIKKTPQSFGMDRLPQRRCCCGQSFLFFLCMGRQQTYLILEHVSCLLFCLAARALLDEHLFYLREEVNYRKQIFWLHPSHMGGKWKPGSWQKETTDKVSEPDYAGTVESVEQKQ